MIRRSGLREQGSEFSGHIQPVFDPAFGLKPLGRQKYKTLYAIEAITCFRPGFGDQGGPVREMSDWDVYEEETMNGGLAFSEEKIKYILEPYFECIEFRAVEKPTSEEVFGVPFLWGSLWRKK